jgi:hypothetical protein
VTTMTEVEKLAKEVAELRQQVLQRKYGMRANQLILVTGNEIVADVVDRRLQGVPAELRSKMKPHVITLPFITTRNVHGMQA